MKTLTAQNFTSADHFFDLLPMESERLFIRQLQPEDLEPFLHHRSDAEVVRYIAPPLDREGVEKLFRDRAVWQGVEGHMIALPIVLKETNAVIGEAALRVESIAFRRAEIGYLLHKEHQGSGLGTEAALMLRDFSFSQLGMHKVTAYCDSRNAPSVKILNKLGMDQEGHYKHHIYRDGQWSDTLAFGLINPRETQ